METATAQNYWAVGKWKLVIPVGKWELKISISSACKAVRLPGPGGRDGTCSPHHVVTRLNVPREHGVIFSLLAELHM